MEFIKKELVDTFNYYTKSWSSFAMRFGIFVLASIIIILVAFPKEAPQFYITSCLLGFSALLSLGFLAKKFTKD